MFKKVLALVAALNLALAAWPASAGGGPAQRLGTGVPTAIAAAPDGAGLAVGSSIGVWFFAADTLTPVSFWDIGEWVTSVQYSVDGRFVRANGRYYDNWLGQPVTLVPGDTPWLAHDCSPDGRYCATQRIAHVIVQDQDTLIHVALLRTDLVHDFAWSPDGRTLYTAGSRVQAWDIPAGTLKQVQVGHFTSPSWKVLWSPDGSQLAFGSALYDVATAQVIGQHVCPGRWPPSDTFNCTGPRLEYYPEFWGERVQVYTDAQATTYRWIEPHDLWARAAALNPSGTLLATSGQDFVRPAGVSLFATCPDCRVVHTTRVWEVSSFARLGQLPVGFDQLAFAMGDDVVVGITAGRLEAWDWRHARQVWVADLPAGRLEVSPNGEYVATAAYGHGNTDIHLWRAATGERVATLTGHTAPSQTAWSRTSAYDVRWPFGIRLTSLAFSPDSTKLAAGSQDGTVLIWPIP